MIKIFAHASPRQCDLDVKGGEGVREKRGGKREREREIERKRREKKERERAREEKEREEREKEESS